MIFILKPKAHMRGVSLKRWYKSIYLVLTGRKFLPIRWYEHPGVAVPVAKLPAVMDRLYQPTPW